ncbi:MAG: hypothetical protein HYV40_05190 [Candidatus Levybacteria bacterium]|nr:hypothetical protein [Candidatus Levybacteria bacterium]
MVLFPEGLKQSPTLAREEVAFRCLQPNGITRVNHTGQEGDFHEAYNFLVDAGCNPAFVKKVIHPTTGRWIFKVRDPNTFLEKPLDVLAGEHNEDLLVPYELAQASLDTIRKEGFNEHSLPHVKDVAAASLQLLWLMNLKESFGENFVEHFPSEEAAHDLIMKIGLEAGYWHDIFNIFSRYSHSFGSVELAAQSFSALTKNPMFFSPLADAIQLHDEPVMKGKIMSWGELSVDQLIDQVRRQINPWARALFVADKIQISPFRLNPRSNTREAIDVEPHAVANHIGRAKELVLSPDRKHAFFVLEIMTEMLDQHREMFPGLAQQSSDQSGRVKPYAPKWMQEQYKGGAFPIPYNHAYEDMVSSLYHDRLVLSYIMLFASFPQLRRIYVVFQDRLATPEMASAEGLESIKIREGNLNLTDLLPSGDWSGKTIDRTSAGEHFAMMRKKHVLKSLRKSSK